MKKLLLSLGLLIALTVSAQHVPKSLTAANGEKIGFYQYTPTDYNANPNTKYPVIIFLHGISERGNGTTELNRILGLGVPGAIEAGHNMTFTWNGKTETFLVLSPQLSMNYGGWTTWHVQEMINYAKKNLRIDEDRIFLTGLSLGGGGVWQFAGGSLANAQQLAAIGVVCGVCPWNINYANLTDAKLPIWTFHNMDDSTVLPSCTIDAVTAINKLNPAVKPYMSLWPTGGHSVWGKAYNVAYDHQNPNLYEWFLAQNRKLPVNKRPVAHAGDDVVTNPTTATVTLNGGKSSDADGRLVRYIWRKITGPDAGKIQNAFSTTSASTLVTGLTIAGTYQYELKVVDDRCDWAMDTVQVLVSAGPPPANNKPPVADAGMDIVVQQPVNQVALKGSATDPDGQVISYTWIQTAGPQGAQIESPNSPTTQVTGLLVGDYTFRLIVVDDKNVTASDDVNVKLLTADGRGSTGVNPGPNVTITLPTNSLTLDGTASYDPYGGKINGWRWLKISGPAEGTVTNTGVAVTTATGLVTGNYVFQLTTWNSLWVPQSATKIVTVLPGTGNPPGNTNIAKAGPDQTVTLPVNSVTLDGSQTVDPTGAALKDITWSKLSGPAGGTIANAKTLTTTATGLVAGTYQFVLTVLNSQSIPSSDTMQVIVKPAVTGPVESPRQIAKAGPDQTITLPTSTVTLDGSQSIDPNGPLLGVEWKKLSGPAAGTITNTKSLVTTVTGLVAGTYQFRLQVSNTQWVPSADTVVIIVKPGTIESPRQIAKAGPDQTITLPVNSITLNGSETVDPTGALKGITWSKLSGPAAGAITNANALTTTVTGLVAGTYQFVLTVLNSQSVPSSDTMQVTVKPAVTGPVESPRQIAKAGPDQTITLPTSTVTLDGSQSIDPNGPLLGVEWKKLSGPAAGTITNTKSLVTTVTGLEAGTYQFRLQVSNTQWVPSADTVIIIVKPSTSPGGGTGGPTESPRQIAKAGPDQTITLPTNTVTLDGSQSIDPNGPLLGVEWKKLSGPAAGTITNTKSLVTTVTGLVAGTYDFRLQVSNTQWVPSADTVVIVVKPATTTPPPADLRQLANAGPDQTITLPVNSITLDGSATVDPRGPLANVTWFKLSGPAGGDITNNKTLKTTATGLTAGTYQFRLVVHNTEWVPSADTMQVIVRPTGTTTLAGARTETTGIIKGNETNGQATDKLLIYPNPASVQINVQTNAQAHGPAMLNIYDMTGKPVLKVAFQKASLLHQQVLNISSLKAGLYQAEVVISNGTRLKTKFVKL